MRTPVVWIPLDFDTDTYQVILYLEEESYLAVHQTEDRYILVRVIEMRADYIPISTLTAIQFYGYHLQTGQGRQLDCSIHSLLTILEITKEETDYEQGHADAARLSG